MKRLIVMVAIAGMFFAGSLYAGTVKRFIKIGFCDVEAVFDNYPGTKDIRQKLIDEKKAFEVEINKQKDKIAAAEKSYTDSFDRLTDEERQRREAEIEYKKEILSEYIDNANKKLEATKKKITTPIYLKIISIIKRVSAEKGYSFVFRKGSKALLYYDKEFDITKDVIYRLKRELELSERH